MIQVFIFNYALFDRAMILFDMFTGINCDTYLLNCESKKDPPFEATNNIIKFPNIYYSGQWNEALKIANQDIMFIINSDVKIQNPRKLISRMERAYKDHHNMCLYAPNLHWTPWTYEIALLPDLGNGLRQVPATDSTVWSLKTSLAQKVGPLPLAVNNIGWGIEIVAAYYAAMEGNLVARDYGIKLEHPQSSAYDRGAADEQFRSWVKYLKLGDKFWNYYNSKHKFNFGWTGDDSVAKETIKLA